MFIKLTTAVLILAFCTLTLEVKSQERASDPGKAGSQSEAIPPEDGVYYRDGIQLVRLQHLLSYGKGLRRRFVPLVLPQRVLKFKGSEAPVKIQEQKPVFVLKGDPLVGGGSIRDVVLVRLEKGRDQREMPVTSGSTVLTYRQVVPKDHTPEISVIPLSKTVFSVVPKSSLPPGEYLLTFGDGEVGGFDFEIVPASAPTP